MPRIGELPVRPGYEAYRRGGRNGVTFLKLSETHHVNAEEYHGNWACAGYAHPFNPDEEVEIVE